MLAAQLRHCRHMRGRGGGRQRETAQRAEQLVRQRTGLQAGEGRGREKGGVGEANGQCLKRCTPPVVRRRVALQSPPTSCTPAGSLFPT